MKEVLTQLTEAVGAFIAQIKENEKNWIANGRELDTKDHGLAVALNTRKGELMEQAYEKAKAAIQEGSLPDCQECGGEVCCCVPAPINRFPWLADGSKDDGSTGPYCEECGGEIPNECDGECE